MKFIALISLIIPISLAQAATSDSVIYSCKKQNFLTPSSYEWAEISEDANQNLTFTFGTGIDTQMIEIFFSSPVTRLDDEHFEQKDTASTLEVTVVNHQLSFSLQDSHQQASRKKMNCVQSVQTATQK